VPSLCLSNGGQLYTCDLSYSSGLLGRFDPWPVS
jgi:hypothetical protein